MPENPRKKGSMTQKTSRYFASGTLDEATVSLGEVTREE